MLFPPVAVLVLLGWGGLVAGVGTSWSAGGT